MEYKKLINNFDKLKHFSTLECLPEALKIDNSRRLVQINLQ